ncbi:LacI family DNA-binding transcriptional regulator [Corynebacterium gerontici]|uniref:HTH-type transcriptional regulator DegA n=1 Tax=Corynebacterium gerontici TaxID=2079234 RepID=A0A3G6J351_9CORY|nr:LacI family DNA-binding transcriptional regulator [Corynebacterium gerontici]AZA10840.1 HTH-type transcriptional regulator DegA [Corynebacterium gerontici]
MQANRAKRKTPVTLRDIAAETGLSVSTISRALANNPAIAEATREHVQQTAKDMRYRPNWQAASLRSRKSNIIGVAVPDIENPFFAALATAIQRAAHAKRCSVMLCITDDDPEMLSEAVEMFAGHRVDGMVVVPHESATDLFATPLEEGIPVVAVDRRSNSPDVPSVVSDPRPGLEAGIRALMENDDITIGYLSGSLDTSTGRERLQVIEELGAELKVDISVYQGTFDQRDGYEGTMSLLAKDVNAIIAGDSTLTMGAMQAFCEQQLEISQEIALLGFDEIPIFRYHNPPLSTVDQQVQRLGEEAFELLIGEDKLSGAHPIVIPTVLHDRESTYLR